MSSYAQGNKDQDQSVEVIKEQLRLYRLIADYSHEAALFHGPEGEPLYASPSCESLTGLV